MNKLQQKLYNLEENPPAGTWQQIAASLDDMAHPFADTLKNASATPPPLAWTNIESALDEQSVGQKLYTSEVTPPTAIWNDIAASLDDHAIGQKLYNLESTPPSTTWNTIESSLEYGETGSRLYAMEVQPPASAWAAITSSLDAVDEKVVPINRNNRSAWRYLVAAVMIGIVLIGAWQFTNRQNGQGEIVQPFVQQPLVTPETPGKKNIDNTDINTSTADLTPSTNQGTLIASNASGSITRKRSNNQVIDYTTSTTSSDNAQYAYAPEVRHPAEQYFVLFKPDGQFIRMSKKWSDMVCCVSGEEQDPDCKDKIQKWQEQIADAPIASSPGNFLDILTLVNTLNSDL